MKFVYTLALAALLLVSSVAQGETRDIRDAQLDIQHPNTLLFYTPTAAVDDDALCIQVNRHNMLDTIACTSEQHVRLYVPKDWTITKVVVFQNTSADASKECRLTFLDDDEAAVVGAPVIDWVPSESVGDVTTFTDTTIWSLSEGDALKFKLSKQDGAPTCDGTKSPQFAVLLYGKVTN